MREAILPNEPVLDALEEGAIIATNKACLFAFLAAAGITRVFVEFDGAGDSGQIESMTAYAGEQAVELPLQTIRQSRRTRDSEPLEKADLSPADAIEQLVFDCLAASEYGWEINEGAFGNFTFLIATSEILLDFHARVLEIVDSSHIF